MNQNKLSQWIRPEILSQAPYHVKIQSCSVKLNQNESPWDWPQEIKRSVTEKIAATPWNRYPQLIPDRLRHTLGTRLEITPEQFVFGKGSNEILQALFKVSLNPGDVLCTLSPTFQVYEILAQQLSARISFSRLDENFAFDRQDLLNRSAAAQVTIICNPNNPTGTLIPVDVIGEIAGQTRGLVVIDEAYGDFSRGSSTALVETHPNVIVLRTFSKAFALAGFRVGYGIMNPELAREVQKGLLPYNVDLPSILAVETLNEHVSLVETRVADIILEREKTTARLNAMNGITALPSRANFFLLKTPLGASKTFECLARKGILVRDVSAYYGCEDYVRITVGTEEDNRLLIAALGDLA